MSSAYHPITLPELFRKAAAQRPGKIALRYKKYGLWQEITWAEYYHRARVAAQALLELGLRQGDFVAIAGENGPEWVILDMGIIMAGGRTVGIYTTNSWQQLQYIVNHAGCRFLFAENEEQVDKWLHMRGSTPQLERVIYWDEKGLQNLQEEKLLPFDDFMKTGEAAETRDPARLDAILSAVQPGDLAVLLYTSGTTGPPKGAMLSHHNLTWMGHTLGALDPAFPITEKDEVMSFLPLCHIFEQLFSIYIHLSYGYTVNFVESPDTVPQNLREISPTVGYAVPRIWEKFHSRITIGMDDAQWINRLAYRLALRIGQARARYKLDLHRRPPLGLRLLYGLANATVFYFLRKRLGLERMRFAFSGAAPISPDVLRFFNAIGLNLIEGYGQTESSGVITSISMDKFRLGTVGKAMPGSDLCLGEDGEILFRSPGVFLGYHKNEEATAATLAGAWLHTGDVGELDEDGYLRIVDRKKDLIITAGGKNIAPQYIENKLKFSPFVNDAIVIGDRRKFLTAIIVLDEENVNKYARDRKIQYTAYSDLAANEAIRLLIQREVDKVNKELARVEQVRKFTILPKRLYEEDGEVTPTMKVKRRFINDTYKDLIEAMYAVS